MDLNPEEKDALQQLVNIAFSRTANSLAELTGHRIEISAPKVEICYIQELIDRLGELFLGEVATVHQVFGGTLSGNAMLILNQRGAAYLAELLTDGEAGHSGDLDISAQEVLTEVGNILLNACLGMFGNLLKVHVTFSVPELKIHQLKKLLSTIQVEDLALEYAVLIYTRFALRGGDISGCLAIVLGVASLERLLSALRAWREKVEHNTDRT